MARFWSLTETTKPHCPFMWLLPSPALKQTHVPHPSRPPLMSRGFSKNISSCPLLPESMVTTVWWDRADVGIWCWRLPQEENYTARNREIGGYVWVTIWREERRCFAQQYPFRGMSPFHSRLQMFFSEIYRSKCGCFCSQKWVLRQDLLVGGRNCLLSLQLALCGSL